MAREKEKWAASLFGPHIPRGNRGISFMRWQKIEDALNRRFERQRLETESGRAFAGRALDLDQTLGKAFETEEEREALDYESALDVLQRQWPVKAVLGFEWQSLGPMVWFSTLGLLDVGGRSYVYLNHEERPLVVLGAIEPENDQATLCALFTVLCEKNEIEFWSFPSKTENYRPDLIPKSGVSRGYWAWLETGDPERRGWESIADLVQSKRVGEGPMEYALGALREGLTPPADPSQTAQAAHDRDEEARRRLLNDYLDYCYREEDVGSPRQETTARTIWQPSPEPGDPIFSEGFRLTSGRVSKGSTEALISEIGRDNPESDECVETRKPQTRPAAAGPTTTYLKAYKVQGFDAQGRMNWEHLVAVQSGQNVEDLARAFQEDHHVVRSEHFIVYPTTKVILIGRRTR